MIVQVSESDESNTVELYRRGVRGARPARRQALRLSKVGGFDQARGNGPPQADRDRVTLTTPLASQRTGARARFGLCARADERREAINYRAEKEERWKGIGAIRQPVPAVSSLFSSMCFRSSARRRLPLHFGLVVIHGGTHEIF